MQHILVVGGAGYIGAHMCQALAASGYRPVVLDDLSQGHAAAVQWGPLLQGDMGDAALLGRAFADFNIAAVMLFAGVANIGASVADPARTYHTNVTKTLRLLQAMRAAQVQRLIFSSSAAVYGEPARTPIDEDHPVRPVTPYGRSKLMVEQVLEDFGRAYGLRATSLRYFNAAGADPAGILGEDHSPETHLIPLVLQAALGQRARVQIYGDDYPTPDGTCVRDYVHVVDLAQAHLAALEALLAGGPGAVLNLGGGQGASVREVVDAAREITGAAIPAEVVPRRGGDPAVLVASSQRACQVLGWRPRYPALRDILETAWRWHQAHPHGYAAADLSG